MAKGNIRWGLLLGIVAIVAGLWYLLKSTVNSAVAPLAGSASTTSTAGLAAGILGFGNSISSLLSGNNPSGSLSSLSTNFLSSLFGGSSGDDNSTNIGDPDSIDSLQSEFDTLV